MRKFLLLSMALASASIALASGPSAQTVTSSSYNSGHISNTLTTTATVSGIGSSFSGATGSSETSSVGTVTGVINPICTGACGTKSGSVSIVGEVSTSNTGTAFNVSAGGGSGSAASSGWADASLHETISYHGPGQSLTMSGDATANSNVSINASMNTGGAASSGNEIQFSGNGLVGSSTCSTGGSCGATQTTNVFGEVSDEKEQTSWAGTGTMTVDGIVLSNAVTNANASAVTNVTGSFSDPQ